jgi:hypothetical protein
MNFEGLIGISFSWHGCGTRYLDSECMMCLRNVDMIVMHALSPSLVPTIFLPNVRAK